MINRLKFYQTGLSIFAPPLTLILHKLNWVNSDVAFATLGIALSGCTFLYSLGYITNNLVGIMYVNNAKSDLKIAYLDFWGRRKDIVVPIKDNVPSSEISAFHTDSVYWKFKNLSTPLAFKISTKFGNVLDKEMFCKIFSKDVY
uniref:Transmembrane protein 186 n=1 Tax=Photinus pyralis TaxID=7054 RepID=A0A1Y1ML63_PHOPY